MSALERIQEILDAEEFGSVITFVGGPNLGEKVVVNSSGEIVFGLIPAEIAEAAAADAVTLMGFEQHRSMEYDDHSVFIETLAPPSNLYIFGAVHIGQALADFGSRMGYRVTVVDSRGAFATDERFPTAERVLVGWPRDLMDQLQLDRRTWIVILSHDPRHEDPVLDAALKSDVRYIGAMGSRRTQKRREERLLEMGFTSDDLTRIHGPVGLDIGAESPQEVAVSILAEMTLVRYGKGSGMSLQGTEGRVHKQREDDSGE